jgi:hypothetical protein
MFVNTLPMRNASKKVKWGRYACALKSDRNPSFCDSDPLDNNSNTKNLRGVVPEPRRRMMLG